MTGSHFKVIQCVRYFWLIRICRGEIRHFLLSLFFYIMDNLVFINESNDVLTDSLRVAAKFEKDHSKVIRSIDDLLEKSYVIDTECNPKMDLHNNRRIGDCHPIFLIFVISYYIYTQNHPHPYTHTRSFPPSSYRSRRTALLFRKRPRSSR